MEINQEVVENAVEIWADLPNTLNEEPYMPSNGTEGQIFINRWCETCEHDDEDSKKYCEILNLSLCGEQQKEWVYFENRPICTAYKKRVVAENQESISESEQQLEIDREWDDLLPDMCTDFDGFVQRIEREKEFNNGL